MHEFSVTQEILRLAVEHAEHAGAQRITDIYLVVGALSSVVDDSVQFYFDMLSPGTIAQGAKLHFERIETKLKCRTCNYEFTPQGLNWNCPQCGDIGGQVVAGKEFYLNSIEVE